MFFSRNCQRACNSGFRAWGVCSFRAIVKGPIIQGLGLGVRGILPNTEQTIVRVWSRGFRVCGFVPNTEQTRPGSPPTPHPSSRTRFPLSSSLQSVQGSGFRVQGSGFRFEG